MLKIWETDDAFARLVNGDNLLHKGYQDRKTVDVDDKQAKDIDMKDERLENSTDNVSIYHRYIETKLDAEWFTIKDAVKNQKYRINECWINALVDTYEGTDLTRVKRGRLAKTLSRDKVLELLEMSEEEFVEKGASINQMDAVFKHFNIPARIFDFNSRIIYRNDPTARAHTRILTFDALAKNNHIHTINQDMASLRQTATSNELEFRTSSQVLPKWQKRTNQIQAFNNIDDWMKLNEEEEYNLKQADKYMAKVVHQFKSAGYEPFVKYQVGMISQVKAKFRYKQLKKTVHYNITAQNLSKKIVHSEVTVCSVARRSRISWWQKCSDLTRVCLDTVRILDERRTIVPSGFFDSDVKMQNLIEVDLHKAFTHAFQNIKNIPTLTEFDTWMPFEGEDLHGMSKLTLYYVEAFEGNIFFNEKSSSVRILVEEVDWVRC